MLCFWGFVADIEMWFAHCLPGSCLTKVSVCLLKRVFTSPTFTGDNTQAVVKIPCNSLWSHKRCISTFFTYTVVPLSCKQTCKWCVGLVDFLFQGNIKRTGHIGNAEKVLGLGQEKVNNCHLWPLLSKEKKKYIKYYSTLLWQEWLLHFKDFKGEDQTKDFYKMTAARSSKTWQRWNLAVLQR